MGHDYVDCPELHAVNELIERYYRRGDYAACFKGCRKLALKGYSLAECQVGYFYLRGQGTPIDLKKALYWTKRAARHGDPDAPENLQVIAQAMAGEHFTFTDRFDRLGEGELTLRIREKNPGDEVQIPFYFYDIYVGETPVGKISVRIGNNIHTDYNGHIGYEVDPPYRGHGYAAAACRLVLAVARYYGLPSVYVTCDESNAPSFRTIEKLGGVLLWTVEAPKSYFGWYEGMEPQRVYRINL